MCVDIAGHLHQAHFYKASKGVADGMGRDIEEASWRSGWMGKPFFFSRVMLTLCSRLVPLHIKYL